MKYIIHNNVLVVSTLSIFTANNRSFKYGDGVFETIICDGSKIKFWSDHVERLLNGLSLLGILFENYFHTQLYSNILSLIEKNKHKNVTRVRLHVWRCEGGFYTPSDNNFEYIIETSDTILPNTPFITTDVCQKIQLSYSTISHLKTCNSLPYIIACIEKASRNLDDLIILDTNGNIAEATSSNIFWTKGKNWYTSSLRTGCIGGVARKNIIRELNYLNIKFSEGEFPIQSLEEADSILLSNVTNIRAAKSFRQIEYNLELANENLNFIQNLL